MTWLKESVLLKLVLIGVYLAPLAIFIYRKQSMYPLITLKTISFNLLIELTLIAWLALMLVAPKYRPKLTATAKLVLLLLGALTLSGFLGVNVVRSFWSTAERVIGIIGIAHFAVYYFILKSLAREFNWRRYLRYLFGISVIVAVFAFIQRVSPGLFFNLIGERPGSFLGNPAYLAGYLIFSMMIGGWLVIQAYRTAGRMNTEVRLVSFALVLEVMALMLGNVRGALLGLAVGGFVWLTWLAVSRLRPFEARRSLQKNIPLLLVVALVLFGGVFYATRSADLWQRLPGFDRLATTTFTDTTVSTRLIAWNIALKAFQEKPLLGYGFENFKYPFDRQYDPSLLRIGFNETYFDKPHNVYLEYLVAGGLLGITSYLLLLISIFWSIFRIRDASVRPLVFSGMLAYATQNFFIFDTFGTYLMLFICMAFIEWLSPPQAVEESSSSESVGHKALWYGVATVGTVFALYLGFVQSKTVYANALQYQGLNYLSNRLPDPAVGYFKRAVKISQPYQNAVQMSFISGLADVAGLMTIPEASTTLRLAVSEMEKAIVSDPNNYYFYATLADSKISFYPVHPPILEGAEEDIATAVSLSPNRQQNFYITSKIKYLNKDVAGAVEEMKKAITLDPFVGEPHFYYGLFEFQRGNNAIGFAEIEKAGELGRVAKNLREYSLLGGYYGDAGKYDVAVGYLEKAVDLSPADNDLRLKLGLVYFYLEQFDKAGVQFKAIVDSTPNLREYSGWPDLEPIFKATGVVPK